MAPSWMPGVCVLCRQHGDFSKATQCTPGEPGTGWFDRHRPVKTDLATSLRKEAETAVCLFRCFGLMFGDTLTCVVETGNVAFKNVCTPKPVC